MEVRTLTLLGSVVLFACAFDAGSVGEGPDGLGSTGEGTATAATTAAATGDATAGVTSSGSTSSVATTSSDPDTTETHEPPPTDTDQDPGSTGELPEPVGCPSPLPEAWIACRDFEDGLGGFASVTGEGLKPSDEGFESDGALSIFHTTNDNWIGSAILRFGAGPAADNVEESGREFDEVYLRLRARTAPDWPAYGHGDLVHLEARVEGQLWPRAHSISLDTNVASGVLSATAFSCIFGDYLAGCSGSGSDWSIMQARGGAMGQVPFATPQSAGEWHCITMHARLNTPGAFDGVLELALDGVPQVAANNIDYRGNWDEVGFNTLTLPSWWPGAGPPSPMGRLIDDLVLSTEPLSCD